MEVDIVCARVIQVGRIPITRPYLGVLRLASVALTKSPFHVDCRTSASDDGSVGAIVPVVRICLVRFSISAAKPIFAFFRVGLLWKQGIDYPFNSSLRSSRSTRSTVANQTVQTVPMNPFRLI